MNCTTCSQSFKEEDAVFAETKEALQPLCPACVFLAKSKNLKCNDCGKTGVENHNSKPFSIVKQKPYAIMRQCPECSSVDIGEYNEDDESAVSEENFDLLW